MKAAGFAPAVKTVNVAVGEYARVPFTLRPQTRTALVPPPPGAVAPVQPVPSALVDAPSAAPKDDPGRTRRYAGLGLVAGGLAAVGGGVAASLTAKHKFDAITDFKGQSLKYFTTHADLVKRRRPGRRGRTPTRNGSWVRFAASAWTTC